MKIDSYQSKRIMFFSAHPDDEMAGAGGFMIKTIKNGGRVKLVLCIDPGEPRLEHSNMHERTTRLSEFKITSKKLGAEWSFLDFPHYPGITYNRMQACVKEIRNFKPEIVLILQEEDYHTEHQMIAKIVKRAVWHASRSAFPKCGKPHKVQELWECEGDRPMKEPNHFEDISDVIEEKKKVFLSYGSQQARKDLVSAFEGLNRFRGIMYKKGEYAETFKRTDFFYG